MSNGGPTGLPLSGQRAPATPRSGSEMAYRDLCSPAPPFTTGGVRKMGFMDPFEMCQNKRVLGDTTCSKDS